MAMACMPPTRMVQAAPGSIGDGHAGQGRKHGRLDARLRLDQVSVPQACARRLDGVLQSSSRSRDTVPSPGPGSARCRNCRACRAPAPVCRCAAKSAAPCTRAADRSRAGPVGAQRIDVAPIQEVVEAEPGPRHNHAGAERASEALGDAHEVAFTVANRERGGVVLAAGGRRQPLLGRSSNGCAILEAQPQPRGVLLRQDLVELVGCRIDCWQCARVPLAGWPARAVSKCSTPLRSELEKSKPSRMRSVSRN